MYRVYFQDQDRNIVEYVYAGGPFTKTATVAANAPPRCSIAVVSCTLRYSLNGPTPLLHYTAPGDVIHEMYNNNGTWYPTEFIQACISGSSIAMISSETDPNARITLYLQQGYLTSTVSEMVYSDTNLWRKGKMALPPVIELVPVADP